MWNVVRHLDASAVGFDNFSGDAESQTEMFFAGPGVLGPVESLKDLFFILVRDAGTVVADFQQKPVFGCRQRKGDTAVLRRVGEGVINLPIASWQ